jgi:hypothetical protein
MADAFLDRYKGQSTEELLALEGKFRTDSLVLAFEEAIQRKARSSISPEELHVLAVEGLEREVNNGGYGQFFANSSSEFAPVIEAALRAIDCPKTADITRDAVAALRVERLTAAAVTAAARHDDQTIQQALGECDERYFASGEPIADRLFRWIAANRDRIQVGGAARRPGWKFW